MTGKDALEILEKAWHGRMDKPDYPNFDDINEALTEIEEDIKEKDRLFAKLYLATEDNKLLLKQNRSLERKNKMLQDQVADLKHQLVIQKLHK